MSRVARLPDQADELIGVLKSRAGRLAVAFGQHGSEKTAAWGPFPCMNVSGLEKIDCLALGCAARLR